MFRSCLLRFLVPAILTAGAVSAPAADDSRDGGRSGLLPSRGITPSLEGRGRATRGAVADDAQAWLMKMNEAPRRFDYEGTFIYQRGAQLDAMRIVHKSERGAVRERLVSLNGAAREIVRDERRVLCYLPDENAVVVEHRKTDAHRFPSVLPERLAELGAHYAFQLGDRERVAGRMAQQVVILPRDGYRYGYRLWADRDTGLLLKTELLDGQGRALEQFMFTQLRLGAVPARALQPENPGEGWVWYREDAAPPAAPARRWAAAQLPGGFKLSHRVTRNLPMRNKAVEHLVYSDGLATVSLFVEALDEREPPGREGLSHMGAVHAYGARVNGHQVTAVGEVPAETVSLIAKSVAPAR